MDWWWCPGPPHSFHDEPIGSSLQHGLPLLVTVLVGSAAHSFHTTWHAGCGPMIPSQPAIQNASNDAVNSAVVGMHVKGKV